MKSDLEFDIKDVPFQPNHISVTCGGRGDNLNFAIEINPNTVPNYRVQCNLTRRQLEGINKIVTEFLKNGG
jgi:hypothetical protein